MTDTDQLETLLDHFDNPRNYGRLADADIVESGGHPECADVVTIYLKFETDRQRVAQVAFEGQGCTVSQAAASLLTELVVGLSAAEIAELDYSVLSPYLGRSVGLTRPRCATLALGTLKAAIARYTRVT